MHTKIKKRNERELIVGMDIGTTKIAVLVGAVADDGQIEVIGLGTHPSNGLKRGTVINIEATVVSMQRAVEEAETMSGCVISGVFAGIAGSHIQGINSYGIVAVRTREVAAADIERVVDSAKAITIPADQKILHVLPQEFIIDNQGGVMDPLGMSGVRLEAKAHIVTGSVSAVQNIVKCVRQCGLETEDVVLEQLASSYAVLTEDEKELGVCMVDIGGGTTDIAVFIGGAVRYTAVIPIAGDQATNDIAVGLRTSTRDANEIKVKYGCASAALAGAEETIEVPSVGDRPARRLSRQSLAEVIGPRYEELFLLVQAELRRSGFESQIAAGIVLTGGSAKLEGAVELAEEIFHAPVRLGAPRRVTGLADVVRSPIYATGVGLLLYGMRERREGREGGVRLRARTVWERMRDWFKRSL